jgi:hypothetical protein
MGSKVNRRTVVPADWLKPRLAPVASTGEFRRYAGINGSYSILPSVSQKGWDIGRLERMRMAEGGRGQRPFIIPALQLVIAITAGDYLKRTNWFSPTRAFWPFSALPIIE